MRVVPVITTNQGSKIIAENLATTMQGLETTVENIMTTMVDLQRITRDSTINVKQRLNREQRFHASQSKTSGQKNFRCYECDSPDHLRNACPELEEVKE
ncbi:hypothetical protein TNCT_422311 [Trichonephila clavata]|uniref:CCHC-type domain-containing protein n=1 Tax=Trichonephila clavata TaxID=2740835 RepID=A0A8X6IP32_TRICU|nr:hypothetical protein TNCT_422311 [Trichonephila clavata]